jgi:hypothetical protein
VAAANGIAPAFNPAPVSPRACGLRTNGQPGISLDNATAFGAVNVASPDLKFPQLLRATLGYDRKLPGNVVASFDGLYSRSINNFFYTNINVPQTPAATSNVGRLVFSPIGTNGTTVLTRPAPQFDDVLALSNQSKDYSYSLTSSLRKRFDAGLEGGVSYTYSRSYAVSDLTSSVALSNWRFSRAYSGLQSDQTLLTSIFDQPHRLLINGTYTAPWKHQTTVTLYYSMQSGTPYGFVYNGTAAGRGDLNGDGFVGNDMIYIPTGPSDPKLQFQNTTLSGQTVTAAQQAANLDAFISANPCLNNQRGEIMKPMSCRNPAFTRFDLTLEQQLPHVAGERVSMRFDFFNFANLLNNRWGKARLASGNSTSNLLSVAAMSSADGATQVPIVTFANNFNTNFSPISFTQFYQIQTSLRVSF